MDFIFRKKKNCSVFSWAGRLPIDKTASVRLKPKLCTFIWANKIFGVKTFMGLEWLEAHFFVAFFDRSWSFPKLLAKKSRMLHMTTSVRFVVKNFSEGCRQDFSVVLNFFLIINKKIECSKLSICLRISVKIFSRKDVGRKKCIIEPKRVKKVASNQLKIGMQVAYG